MSNGIRVCTLLVAVLVAGCFNPTIKNGGFTCSGTQPNECPNGYFCVNGYCLDNPNGVGPRGGVGGNGAPDMTSTPNGDLSVVVGDMSMPTIVDMAQANATIDMSRLPPDMVRSTGNCAHDYCTTGAALSKSCDPCVTTICNMYSNCCSKTWSSLCVSDVNSLCNNGAHCP